MWPTSGVGRASISSQGSQIVVTDLVIALAITVVAVILGLTVHPVLFFVVVFAIVYFIARHRATGGYGRRRL